jgi:hypothetical protein
MPESKELRADDCRRDDMVDVGVEDVFSLFSHSFKLLISPPSTLTVRGSAGFPKIVPVYLESSSVALCFFLRTSLC